MFERVSSVALRFTFSVSAVSTLAFSTIASAQAGNLSGKNNFSVVYEFESSPNAAYPWAGLVQGADGNLYGSTWAGGKPANCKGGLGSGCGTLFRLDSSGKETVVWSFKGVPGPIHLYGSLLPTKEGAFYGLTNEGGAASFCYQGGGKGCGTAFRLNADGTLDVLYNFGTQGGWSDALFPAGDLIRCGSGKLCATSSMGGDNNNGTIFELSKNGQESVLYRFTDGADGGGPGRSLTSDPQGNLYGVTAHGGGACNCGTVFKFAPDGSYAVLYTFLGGSDGGNPIAGLIRDDQGNLFGTTALYGDSNCNSGSGCGVVFKLAPDGTESVLHTFSAVSGGILPNSQLTQDSRGNLYGTTWVGGDTSCDNGVGCGVVFEVAANGRERTLHAFHGKDGLAPWGRVLIDAAGSLIGTTQQGGRFDLCSNGCGVIYRLSTGAN